MFNLLFFCLLSHSALIILPSDQILLQASVLLTSSVCHLAVKPGSHGLLLKLLQLGGREIDSLGQSLTQSRPLRAQRPAPFPREFGREAQPVVITLVRGDGVQPGGLQTVSPHPGWAAHLALRSMWLAAMGGRRMDHTGKILTLPLLVFIQRLVSWPLTALGPSLLPVELGLTLALG